MKQLFHKFCLSILLLPALSFAAGDLLLGEDELSAKIAKEPSYQLLDARPAATQQAAPLAFSIRYEKVMPIKKGLVFVVADTDAAALEIAQSIPATERSVFAVKGGAEAWKRVASKAAAPSAMPDSFVIPMNTCEQSKPLSELKTGKPVQKSTKSVAKPEKQPQKK
jgi:hypothetical protein